MSYDDWPDSTMENRRAAVRKTIRLATFDELKKLGEERFAVVTDPWCERYNNFLKEHAGGKIYRAEVPDGAVIVYCRDTEQGVWFLPGSGAGIIQPKGLEVLKQIVDTL